MTNGDELLSTARVNQSQPVDWEPQTFVQLENLIEQKSTTRIFLMAKKNNSGPNNCCRPWKWHQNWEAIDQTIKCLLFAHPWWTQGWLQAHHRCIPGWLQVRHKFSSAGRLQVQVREGRIHAEVNHNRWKEVLKQNPKDANRNETTWNECFLW